MRATLASPPHTGLTPLGSRFGAYDIVALLAEGARASERREADGTDAHEREPTVVADDLYIGERVEHGHRFGARETAPQTLQLLGPSA